MTNAEWLRSLSDEQLLDWLVDHACMTERSCNERCHDRQDVSCVLETLDGDKGGVLRKYETGE